MAMGTPERGPVGNFLERYGRPSVIAEIMESIYDPHTNGSYADWATKHPYDADYYRMCAEILVDMVGPPNYPDDDEVPTTTV